jgi:nitroreductase
VTGEAAPHLHDLLRARWSPLLWDQGHEVSPDDVACLIEAARWAPSAGNSQPWSFVIARRGDDNHRRLVPHLAGSSQRWAPHASVLVVNLGHLYVEGTDWDYSEFAGYDVGQAVAHMTVQGQAMGLYARQFRAFDREAVSVEFDVPRHWQPMTITAFGVPAPDPPPVDGGRTSGPLANRSRRDPTELLWPADPA